MTRGKMKKICVKKNNTIKILHSEVKNAKLKEAPGRDGIPVTISEA